MANPRTPGVYVREIPTLPPSVAEVSTAIPAFIGYTEKGPPIKRISTLLEYETEFGYAKPSNFSVTVEPNDETGVPRLSITRDNAATADSNFSMYYSLSLYFNNGGGSCYVISIGNYDTADFTKLDQYKAGLNRLATEDEPTLIVMPDAVHLNVNNYYTLCVQALEQCAVLQDRFCILDVLDGTDYSAQVSEFRNGIQNNNLKYGAAYLPYLETSLIYEYDEVGVALQTLVFRETIGDNGLIVTYEGDKDLDIPQVEIQVGDGSLDFKLNFVRESKTLTIILPTAGATGNDIVTAWNTFKSANPSNFEVKSAGDGTQTISEAVGLTPLKLSFSKTLSENGIIVTYVGSASASPQVRIGVGTDDTIQETTFATTASGNTFRITITLPKSVEIDGSTLIAHWEAWKADANNNSRNFDISRSGTGSGKITQSPDQPLRLATLESIKSSNTALYNQIVAALAQERVTLPPSSAVAGVYATVDRTRGVWKAPANVSLASVIAPVVSITNQEQELLNVDPTSGKSINAIRSFTGKGTLVWGARTLAGNDNEWRYINVRRLFSVIEESIQKATAFAVFEANNTTTWLKVKAMIESYLFGLWEQGALAGSTPDAAYFVNVGLGKTMRQQDVLEGRMIVRIGVAAVRPAEFIILEFTHKLQEA